MMSLVPVHAAHSGSDLNPLAAIGIVFCIYVLILWWTMRNDGR